MYTLLNNTASDFANSTPVDRIGFVPPADPMNCAITADALTAQRDEYLAYAEAIFCENNIGTHPLG